MPTGESWKSGQNRRLHGGARSPFVSFTFVDSSLAFVPSHEQNVGAFLPFGGADLFGLSTGAVRLFDEEIAFPEKRFGEISSVSGVISVPTPFHLSLDGFFSPTCWNCEVY